VPGDIYLTDYDYGAGLGYQPGAGADTYGHSEGAEPGHTSFVIWLVVFTVGSLVILHGLRLGGFTFVFRR